MVSIFPQSKPSSSNHRGLDEERRNAGDFELAAHCPGESAVFSGVNCWLAVLGLTFEVRSRAFW